MRRGGIPRGEHCPGCGGKSTGVHLDRELLPKTVVHAAPPNGSGMLPCCGKTIFEARGDRVTLQPTLVTCRP